MPIIANLQDVINAQIRRCADDVIHQFRYSVRPVYRSKNDAKPALVGGCTLLSVDGTNYVVTAAHLLDQQLEYSLHIGGAVVSQLTPIAGTVVSTALPEEGRKHDKIDLGFCRIADESIPGLGRAKFLDSKSVAANQAPTEGRSYTALGFPLSRNKNSVNHEDRKIRPTLRSYTSRVVPMPTLADDLHVSGHDHLFLEYEKYALDSSGRKSSSFNPAGLSGGPLIDLGNFAKVETLASDYKCVGHLAGVVIERNVQHHALIAVKIQVILDAIRIHGAP